MNKRLLHYLELAKKAASNSIMTNRHGAILFSQNIVISVKPNEQSTHLIANKKVPSLHSETNCLYSSLNKINEMKRKFGKMKLEMLVVRIDKYGGLMNSQPCLNCCIHLQKFGLQSIYYSLGNGLLCKMPIVSIVIVQPELSSGWKGIEREKQKKIQQKKKEKEMKKNF